MDEKHNPNELNLEDIMREFGSTDILAEDDVLIWGEEPQQKPAPAAPQDTVPFTPVNVPEETVPFTPVNVPEETVTFTPVSVPEETVAFTPVSAAEETIPFAPVGVSEETISFQPLAVEEEPPLIVPDEDVRPKAEPYSETWEPEYEEPISEYVPTEPIVHQPKSRIKELKKKLVAGPERRYYDLVEQGLSKIQLAIFVNLIIAMISAGATAMYTMGAIPADRTRLLIFVQFLTLLMSGLLGSYQLMDGFVDMLRLRFSMNSLLIFSLLACLVDAVLCLQNLRVPACAVFSLHMTMSLWSTYHKRNTEMGQMDTMRRATRLYGVVAVPDYYEGRNGFLRSEGEVEDFMDHYNAPSGVEKTLSIYALVALGVSVAIGITAGVMHSAELGVQAFSAALLVSVPASSYVCISRPTAILERRLHGLGAVICGWEGVKELSRPGVFPLNDADLFPNGFAKMNGVKFYGDREPDTVIAYGAALISACGGCMEPLFSALLESRNGYHYAAKELRSYPAGGVSGEVNGETVLAGSLKFMQDMGVEIPKGTKINQAVYVAIGGQLSGVFAISYGKIRGTMASMTTLCSYRNLTPVLTSTDFMLTEGFVRKRYGVNPRRVAFPDRADRIALAQIQPEEGSPALALYTQEGLAAPAFLVTGARALRKACRMGVAVHMLGGILGLVMMLLLAVLGASALLTPSNVLLYQLIWMIPGLLFTEWARSV